MTMQRRILCGFMKTHKQKQKDFCLHYVENLWVHWQTNVISLGILWLSSVYAKARPSIIDLVRNVSFGYGKKSVTEMSCFNIY